jgi:hypothetical protein
VVWIPRDDLGISDDEISFVQRTYGSLWISNEGASLNEQGKLEIMALNEQGKLEIMGHPPDTSN